MVCFPNCKINLGLRVVARREDGYHDLETVFYPLSECDVLEAVPGSPELVVSGASIAGAQGDNLVWKAYTLLKQAFPQQVKPLRFFLHKAVPMGAGLGGGSADGAFALKLINELFGLQLSKEQLMEFALKLGSDCPFFILNKPAYATGRGEILAPIPIDLNSYEIRLECPGIAVSTAEAFKNIAPQSGRTDLREILAHGPEAWRGKLENDFEKTVFLRHPTLAAIKDQFYAEGAVYASMSGTGSAVYGIFKK